MPIDKQTEAQPASPNNQSEEVPELVAAQDAKQLVHIKQILAVLRQQDEAKLEALIASRSEAVKVIKAACKRGDLTLQQTRLVLALVEDELRQQRQWLLAEKRRLEQKRDSRTRA